MNAAEYIRKTIRYKPDSICVIEAERSLTYSQVEDRAGRLSQYLIQAGVKPGDRVAIFQVNCFQFAEMIYSILSIGAIVVTLNFRLRQEETKYILNNAQAKVLIAGDRYIEMIDLIRSDLSSVKRILFIGDNQPGAESYETALAAQIAKPLAPVAMRDEDGACIIYTSGTTGLPKGAVITHANLLTPLTDTYTFKQGTLLINVPMYHIAGIVSILLPLYRGDKMIILPTFDPGIFLQIVEREKVNTTYLVPTMLQAVIDHPDFSTRDLSSISHIGYGASPMPINLLLRAKELLRTDFTNFFGQTETTGIVSVLSPDDHDLEGDRKIVEEKIRRLSGIGRSIPEGRVRVVDDQDNDVPIGEVGEIVTRSPKSMKGYWRNEIATQEALRNGWLHTGDLACMDEEGYLYLRGRKKDMIIRGGENIYSVEVEAVLNMYPKVEESAVIGIPDDYWGEIVKAVIVLKEGQVATQMEIIEYCRSNIASYKKPDMVEFCKALPKNAMQKVLKTVLREQSLESNKSQAEK